MGDPTTWMVTVVTVAAVLLVTVLEEALRRRIDGLRFQHELRRGAYPRLGPSLRGAPALRPAPVPVVERPVHRRAA